MKPNLNFLKKVRDGKVFVAFSYSPRKGGYYRFAGGEDTAQRHASAGFISMPGAASLGRPALAKLTEAGKAVLAAQQA